jgi:hypothetical protein
MAIGRTTRATLVFLVLFAVVVIYLSTTIARYECEVCVTFGGGTVCRTAASDTREASIESAVTSACGTLASGMTEAIRCQNTEPERVDCRER